LEKTFLNSYIAKINPDGTQLIYSTFLGGESTDRGAGIAVDQSGNAVIVGNVKVNFPTTNGSHFYAGYVSNCVLAKLNESGSELVYSTYILSSIRSAYCYDVALDTNGGVYFTGAKQIRYQGDLLPYVVKTDFADQIEYLSTIPFDGDFNYGEDIYVDGSNNVYITGGVSSGNIVETDGFAAKANSSGNWEYVTIIEGSVGRAITADTNGNAYITSRKISLTKLSSNDGSILYSKTIDFIDNNSGGCSISLDNRNNLYISGTASIRDAFVVKLDINGNAFVINEISVFNSCNVSGECAQSAQTNANATWGGPINTRTGGLFYQAEDITLPTAAKEMNFFRTYSSLATDLYSSILGYGWTHSLDTRLVFPNDPGGEEGYVLFKAHTANQYLFADKGGRTYTPMPGIVGSLVFDNNQYVLTYPDQTVYTFDSTGKLLTWVDTEGYSWTYDYNVNGQLEQVNADNGARFLSIGYDDQGRIVSVIDHANRSISYTYDGNGDLVSASSLGGGTWQYEYDASHRLTRVIDPMGNTDERTEYDAQGRAVRQWDGLDNLLGEVTYHEDGITTITDVIGNAETHTYDERLTLTGTEDGAGGMAEKAYDRNFRPVTITDADEDTTTLTWSADGANLIRVVDAMNGRTDITYDALNNPASVIDPLNHLTTYEYEGTLLTKVVDATQGETTYTYTTEGYLESVTDGEGVTTTYGYDSLGQRTSMTDEFQHTWEYVYDDLGRLVDQTDPLERVTHNEYDTAGRLISVTRNYDPNRAQNANNEWNIVTEYEYDAAGNQTLVRDTLGRETKYEYDAAGRLVKTTDPELHETISEYNEAGQLSATIDALQHHIYYFYDEAGRLKETRNELEGTSKTIYNLDGTVASTTDELNRTTYYEYDDLKRVKVVTQPGGGQTTNTYDKLGNLVSVEDPLGQITQYEYDAVGRQIKTINPDLKVTESFYDDAGRLIQTIDAKESHTTYVYDDAGRLERVIDQLEGTTTYEYDEAGRKSAVIDANQNRTEYTYDNLDRVVAVTNARGTVYTEYDAAGQVLSRTDANGSKTEFTYTVLGQLETQKDAAGGTTTYGYDAVGNRISVQDANFHTTHMEYDELNRLVKVIDPELSATRTVYDAAGQVVATFDANDQETKYEYNLLGAQIKVIDPLQHEVQYTYNAAGQMIGMLDANNIATAYEYDALGRLKAVIENYQAAVQPTAEINVRTEYTYDENGNRRTIKDGNGHVRNG